MSKITDETFMALAIEQAKEALKNKEFPVGAIFVYKDRVIATGKRQNSNISANEIDHAEIVGLRELLINHRDIPTSKVSVYSTMEPCLMCYTTLIVNGIRKVVYGYEDAMGGGTNLLLSELKPLYKNIEMEVVGSVMRDECLQLFKAFFANPDTPYLKDTLLAKYTLQQ